MHTTLIKLIVMALFGLVFSAGSCSSTPRRTVDKTCLDDPTQAKCISDSSVIDYCTQYPEDPSCHVTTDPNACTPPTGLEPKVDIDSGGTRNTTVIYAQALCAFGCVELRLVKDGVTYKPILDTVTTSDNDKAPCCPYKDTSTAKKLYKWTYKLQFKENVQKQDPNFPNDPTKKITVVETKELAGGQYSAQFFYKVKTSPQDPNYDPNCNGQDSYSGQAATELAPLSKTIPDAPM